MKINLSARLCALSVCAALAGCSNKQIDGVKNMTFDADFTLTIGQAFDHRKVCDSVKWDTLKDDRDRLLVEYRCYFKGIDTLVANTAKSSNPLQSIDEVFQWSTNDGGAPVLMYVGSEMNYEDGTIKDHAYGNAAAAEKLIADNKAADFSQYSSLFATQSLVNFIQN